LIMELIIFRCTCCHLGACDVGDVNCHGCLAEQVETIHLICVLGDSILLDGGTKSPM
jgi:hypothetical protein